MYLIKTAYTPDRNNQMMTYGNMPALFGTREEAQAYIDSPRHYTPPDCRVVPAEHCYDPAELSPEPNMEFNLETHVLICYWR